jgi:tetratricopeptide (TPR) repeat protein
MRWPASIVFLLSINCFSQQVTIDSLKKKLRNTKEDSSKANLLYDISYSYGGFDYDSALRYAMLSLQQSKRVFPKGQVRAYAAAGVALRYSGNYTTAIEFFLKGLQMAEKYKMPEEIFLCYQGLSTTTKDLGDYKLALDYGKKAMEYEVYNGSGKMVVSGNFGDLYERMNKLDSALYYANMSYEEAMKQPNVSYYGKAFTLETLGNIEEKMGNHQLAIAYLTLSVQNAVTGNVRRELAEACISLSKIYLGRDQTDSAYRYASFVISNDPGYFYKLGIANASELIEQYFEKKRMLDSALFYYKLSVSIRDKILSEEKIRQVQNLQFNEKIRQQELAAAKAQEKEERAHDLQLISIALFIILFIAGVIVLRHARVNPKWIEFLGILALLLLFEFIVLLLHPFIMSITGHQPIFTLLALVCIAAVLIPSHHRAEKWVKQKINNDKMRPVKKETADEQ